jgi:hypothetical protein
MWIVEQVRLAEGWQPDPFGRHDQRWISAGTPTDLVRDGRRERRDAPVEGPPPEPPPKQHWIDVDRLPTGTRARVPWPLNRIPPSYPVPERTRWHAAAAVALACCSVFVGLAISLGHVRPFYVPPLPRGEVVAQVVGVSSPTAFVSYNAPGANSNAPGDVIGVTASPGVGVGQSVVVNLDTDEIVTTSPPSKRVGKGFFGAVTGVVVLLALALRFWLQWSSTRRRLEAREFETDYRDDQWAGTSNSA